jgi:hypothetical protein
MEIGLLLWGQGEGGASCVEEHEGGGGKAGEQPL